MENWMGIQTSLRNHEDNRHTITPATTTTRGQTDLKHISGLAEEDCHQPNRGPESSSSRTRRSGKESRSTSAPGHPTGRYGMMRTAAASTHTELARTPNGSNTQPCSEVQEICAVAVFLSSSAVRVMSLSCSILFLSLPRSLWFSLCFSLFSVFCTMTSHSELRTYTRTSNKVYYCCCTSCQVYDTEHHSQAVSYTALDRALQMVDCCIIQVPVLSLFVCDSSCLNASPFVLCRCHCRYHRCKDVRRVATVHISSMPVRLYHCQYVGRGTRYC